MPHRHDRILAIDPGLRELGYALLCGEQLVTAGVLPLKFQPPRWRLREARRAMRRLLRGYDPTILVLEATPARPLDGLGGLPALGRYLRRLAPRRDLALATYSARVVRQTVVGNGWAGKREVAEATVKLFPELKVHLGHDRKWKDRYWQNLFDAVALGLHYQSTHPPSRSRSSD